MNGKPDNEDGSVQSVCATHMIFHVVYSAKLAVREI